MNRFLASLEITFRRDRDNFRPRVNKLNSIKDREQKGASIVVSGTTTTETLFSVLVNGNYFFLEE
jgi:hypothetical protein